LAAGGALVVAEMPHRGEEKGTPPLVLPGIARFLAYLHLHLANS
jgi:hypothetical protein